ncbi:MAG: DUF480 domain-containing protein [Phycisphaerae bacterium]
MELTAVQRRVLGVLIEKSMTTPAQYPLTLTAILTGCNQLTCRDPVMHVSEGDVGRAVHELQLMQLVSQAPPDRNARSNRFRHEVEARFGWAARERALMAELMLRGPQTVGELKTNASRMTPLEDLHYVGELLATLGTRDPVFVRELPRQPGKSVVRFDHALYTPDEVSAHDVASAAAARAPAAAESSPVAAAETPPTGARLTELEQRVAALEQAVAELRARPGS